MKYDYDKANVYENNVCKSHDLPTLTISEEKTADRSQNFVYIKTVLYIAKSVEEKLEDRKPDTLLSTNPDELLFDGK